MGIGRAVDQTLSFQMLLIFQQAFGRSAGTLANRHGLQICVRAPETITHITFSQHKIGIESHLQFSDSLRNFQTILQDCQVKQ